MEDCIFCNLDQDIWVESTRYFVAIRDQFPVTPGHLLIIPKAHRIDFFDLTREELAEIPDLLKRLKDQVIRQDSKITGFNIGANCGASAGQSVFHCHIHLIPRRDGDVQNPRGGVRGVIPAQQDYLILNHRK